MLQSMTGYGRGVIEESERTITVEIRTLNNKFLDINMRIPQDFRRHEMELRKTLSKHVLRGKIDFSLNIDSQVKTDNQELDVDTIAAYKRQLSDIASRLELEVDNPMSLLLNLPGVLRPASTNDHDKDFDLIRQAFDQAVSNLKGFRLQEGKSMVADIIRRLDIIAGLRKEVESREPSRKEHVRQRIEGQLKEWAGAANVDVNRLEQEMIYYIEKLDVTEELVRLDSHLKYFGENINGKDIQKGKKLGFIAQEIGREINTIGSKANDADIQQLVVRMKDELEKIKEQVLNIL